MKHATMKRILVGVLLCISSVTQASAAEEAGTLQKTMLRAILFGGPQGQKSLHTLITEVSFFKKMFNGNLTPASYLQFLTNDLELYTHLEKRLVEHAGDPLLAGMIHKPVFRSQAYRDDIAFIKNHFGLSDLSPTPAAQSMAAEIDDASLPRLLVVTYILHAALFNGANVANTTANWLAKRGVRAQDIPSGTHIYRFSERSFAEWHKLYAKVAGAVTLSASQEAFVYGYARTFFEGLIMQYQSLDEQAEPCTKKLLEIARPLSYLACGGALVLGACYCLPSI